MKKLLIGTLLLIAGVAHCGQLTYTTAKTQALLNRVNETGWAVYFGSTNSLTVAGDRNQIEIDGLGSATETNYLPATSGNLWVSNQIVSGNTGNAFECRLQFQADPAQSSDTHFDVEWDIGGAGTNVISTRTITSPKGADPFVVSIAIPLFSLGTFVTNGCSIFINADSAQDFTITNFSIMVKQDYFDN